MTNAGSEVLLSRLELVVLARLSSAKPPSAKDLGDAVHAFALVAESPAHAREAAVEALGHLHQRGLVADLKAPRKRTPGPTPTRRSRTKPPPPPAPGRVLTDSGRRVLCAALKLENAPGWGKIREAHLPALALGLQPGSEDARRTLEDASTIATAVLRTELGVTRASTVTALSDALIAEALGLPPGPITLSRIRAHVLARRAGVEAKGDPEQVAARLAAKALRARGADKRSMTRALAQRWVSTLPEAHGGRPTPPSIATSPPVSRTQVAASPAELQVSTAPLPAQPVTGEALLVMVRDAIPTIGADGRFGPEKVFVSAIWHRLERNGRVHDFSLDRFKQWLVAANRDRLLDLARADLVGAMDPRLVAESEIEDLGSTFHFVLDRRVLTLESERRIHAR